MAEAESTKVGCEIPKFTVNNVKIGAKQKTVGTDAYQEAWAAIAPKGVEAFSAVPKNTVGVFSDKNILAKMVHDSFYGHYPLELSPDAIWITIMQGFALHVHQNSEELREKFVDFDGKKQLVINRPSFKLGADNDWPSVFPEFESLIQENIGEDTTKMITQEFSTTKPVDKITMQIVLMDVVESYFEYVIMCGCGIPSIQLTGTVEDWVAIRERAARLSDFDLEWWTDALLPVLDKLVEAAKGTPDARFFASICNLFAGSGMRKPVTGWVQVFFPYLVKGKERGGFWGVPTGKATEKDSPYCKNTYLGNWKECYDSGSENDYEGGFGSGRGCGMGVKLDSIPASISSVPFKLKDLSTGQTHELRFCAGLTSISQDDDGTVRCNTGWAVLNGSEPFRINTKGKSRY